GFDFSTPALAQHLTGKLAGLKSYNALSVPVEYFDTAMTRLREKYLNVPLDAGLHPSSGSVQQAVKNQQAAASVAPIVEDKELTAQELLERHAVPPLNADDQISRLRDLWSVMYQAPRYTTPTYFLDTHLAVVAWNVAFEVIFRRILPAIRRRHSNHFIM